LSTAYANVYFNMSVLNFDELWEKLNNGDESVEIEAKRSQQFSRSMLETISAFSNEPNLGGGYIILGVEPSSNPQPGNLYTIIGVPNPDQIQSDIASASRDLFNLPISPQIHVYNQSSGKNVLIVFVPEAQPQEKPVYIKSKGLHDGAFRRIGSTDHKCTEEDLQLFFQLRSYQSFDSISIADTSIDDFDPTAIQAYRKARTKINPNASELQYDDRDLLYTLAAINNFNGQTCASYAGLMLFGKESTLRRHFPMARVDYIRINGREWVENPYERYESLQEKRGPLLTLIPEIVRLVLNDIPTKPSFNNDDVHRSETPLIPHLVIREAIVNALMHRNYRTNQPVQIIRYSNRLEMRNPGISLIPDDKLGEPGSVTRNPKIAAALHEAGLAETKGSGIRTMRKLMKDANLTLPVFESEREKDLFLVILLTHHLIGSDELEWLTRFRDCNLTDDEAYALVVIREFGAINNTVYRNINNVDTLTASTHLRRLRNIGLLAQKGNGANTYYVPTKKLISSEEQYIKLQLPFVLDTPEAASTYEVTPLTSEVTTQTSEVSSTIPTTTPEVSPKTSEITSQTSEVKIDDLLFSLELPSELISAVKSLRKRSTHRKMHSTILKLCQWRPLRLSELALIIGRNKDHIAASYIRPMLDQGELEYLFPETPAHPKQAYKTKEKR
jgi:ATP-dependent DNA helicase RecG